MVDNIYVHISNAKLDVQKCITFVKHPSCGAISTFIGTVRNTTQNKKVRYLEFTGYESMAIKEMEKIAKKALSLFKIKKIAIEHTLGKLEIGDIPVVIAISSAHRKAAFTACEFAIDELKKSVPIWKKEFFEDSEVWVNTHP